MESDMVRRWWSWLACAGLLAMAPGAAPVAEGPALLLGSVPPAGAKVAAPERLVLRFNGRIEKRLSGVTLVGGPGEAALRLTDPEPGMPPDALAYRLPPIEPGAYRVEWKVLAVDGHFTEGVVRFTVVPSGRMEGSR